MFRMCLAASGIALLSALVSNPNAPSAVVSAEVEETVAQPPVAEVASPTGYDLVLGSIDGVINVNGEPTSVASRMIVRGNIVGPNSSVGTALAKPRSTDGGGRPTTPSLIECLTFESIPWVIPDSMLDEMAVLSATGDWAVFQVDFGRGGYLRYDISVECADPLVLTIALSGELTGETGALELPWNRSLNLHWHADGTLTGDGSVSGQTRSGQAYYAPVVIAGRYFAANPRTSVPAHVYGKLTITSFDPDSGQWTGVGSRAVKTVENGAEPSAPGED